MDQDERRDGGYQALSVVSKDGTIEVRMGQISIGSHGERYVDIPMPEEAE